MGDRDGAVVIPQRDLARIADVLEDIRRMESESQKKIAAGMTHPEAIADLLKSDRVAYLD
jgi:regulator of RNase E activity RraA